ncbi:MAG: hypothetical protein J7K40_11620 [candidate division Zixibacteria bacterium]|nr:hypothetical protein [candidate division Zixibacteria bacterium]
MRKLLTLLLITLIAAVLFVNCDRRKAIDQILEKPEMKSYLMSKMLENETIKADITNQLFADTIWVSSTINRLTEQMDKRQVIFEKLLGYEGMSDMMLEKMAENPDLKKKMRAIGRRR